MSRRGVFRCSLAAVLFGLSAPAASRLADDLGAFGLAGLLYLGAAAATLVPTVRHPPHRRSLRAGARQLTVAVVVGGAVGPLLLAAGLQRTTAATASLLLNLELVFTILIAGLFFKEHIGRRVANGTVLVVIAGVLLGWSGAPAARWGALLVAGACLCWAVDNSVTAALDELAPAHITFVKGLVAGGANLGIGLAIDGVPPLGVSMWALAVGVVGYGMSITLWVAGARDLGAARGQLVFATAPFIGAIVAWIALGEQAKSRELAAAVLAAGGVLFVMRSGHEHAHSHDAVEHDHEHVHDDDHHLHEHEAGFQGRHQHPHVHAAVGHAHPHVPDLHHRHSHG